MYVLTFSFTSGLTKKKISLKALTLRTPSPGPPLSAELSTIVEADNSGVSKHIPANSSLPTINHTKATKERDPHGFSTLECDIDTSALDLSTTHLADQVRDAIREGDSLKKQWLNTDKAPIIIDGDDDHPSVADTTFMMDTVDRDLAFILNPQSTTEEVSSPHKNPSNPTTPNLSTSPASRLPRARQASSFLPRLRSPNSPTAPQFPIRTLSPKQSSSIIVNGTSHPPIKPSSPPVLPSSTSTSTPITSRRNITLNHTTRLFSPSSSRAIKVFGGKQQQQQQQQQQPRTNGSAIPSLATRTLRQVILGVRTNEGDSTSPPSTSRSPGRISLDSRRASPSFDIPRGASLDSRTRPASNRPSTSPSRIETASTSPDIPFEDYRPSFDSNITARPSADGIINSAGSRNKHRTTPSLRVVDTTVTARGRTSPIPPNPPPRMRKRSMSVQDRFGRDRVALTNKELGEGLVRSGSSLSIHGGGGRTNRLESGNNPNENGGTVIGPKMEWLGPRTAKAFRAAGLLDFEREKESREEASSGEPLRDRSGGNAASGVLSPSALGIGNPTSSTANRFASLRSASEYNPIFGRSHSRLALSEAGTGGTGGPGRRGSESLSTYGGGASSYGGGGGGGGSSSTYGHNNGLMESPTFTVSSGSRERDTPKSSISTAPTSLADSFGYLGRSERDLNRDRDRDREREEIREMKEKHGIEMGALLGALSDSQRTVRVLREENSDLRDRLERLTAAVQAHQELRQVCGNLQNECNNVRRENMDLRKELITRNHSWSGGGNSSSGLRTPIPKPGSNSPLARTFTSTSQQQQEEYDNTFIDHGSEVENYPHYPSSSSNRDTPVFDNGADSSNIIPPSSSSHFKKRRLSNSSSIFPIPPSNMTLLLNEDATSTLGSIGSTADPSFSSPPPANANANPSQRKTHMRSLSQSPPISYQNFAGNIPSHTSVGSISPSTAHFSMVTGSPGSLFLRPEHEILLGDMESLDLGVPGGDGELVDEKVDGW